MIGYRCSMRNVKLNFLLAFFLIFGFAYQGYADCPSFVKSNTVIAVAAKQTGKGAANFFTFKWGDLNFDQGLLQNISVKAIKDQGVSGYFNPKIKVCDYEGNNCKELYDGTSCEMIYGTKVDQHSGAGISAMAFIDWEGNKKSIGATMGEGLKWEWADGVTPEEQEKFANSPKICACSQKGACMQGGSTIFSRLFSGSNILEVMENVCDTCYQTKIKCAPVPLAPGPPPFCEQLGMSPPQVRIVPITNNDYFNPKVKVIVGNILKEEIGEVGRKIGFPADHGKDKAHEFHIPDSNGTTYYFTTYREKGQLCAEYYGTQEINKKNWQFSRCFPAPHAPVPKEIKINSDGSMLEIKIKMSSDTCTRYGRYDGDSCVFNINTNSTQNVGPLSLKVVKPQLVDKTTDSSNRGKFYDTMKKILDKNTQFEILEKYDFVPDILVGCAGSNDFYDLKDFDQEKLEECNFDSNRRPEIEIKYKENPKSKMLCISGWKPEPEEFILERGDKIIPLKKMGASYAKYNTVFSRESNQPYDYSCNETVDLLAKPQSELDEIIFNKRGYISIPEENKRRDACIVKETSQVDAKQNCNNCKLAYKLKDVEHKEIGCTQGDDGCICIDNACERSTQYVTEDNRPFYLRVSQKPDGTVENSETPIKVDRTEVFYADKLCVFDLTDLKEKLKETIVKQLETRKLDLLSKSNKSYGLSGKNDYTDDLSRFDHVEIEAWGGGEAGHIKGEARSIENRQGMPGDYIKAKLRIDPRYPLIRVRVTEGGGGQKGELSNKDGGPTIIEMCDLSKRNCKKLITVAGGGKYKVYGIGEDRDKYKDTKIHIDKLKLGEPTIVTGTESIQDNRIAYIEDGEIKHKEVTRCDNGYVDQKHGSGGCVNQGGKNYSKGSPGHVNIKPVMGEIDYEKINDAIKKSVENPTSITAIDDHVINELDPGIVEEIKKQIRQELSGQVDKE
jgi:hypothetical protein